MVPSGWSYKSFEKILKLDRGSSPRPIVDFVTDKADGVNWIKIGDAIDGKNTISITKEKITKEGAKKSRKVFSGEIILSNSMSYGKPYILEIDGCIHDGWFVIRNYEKNLEKEFLIQLLASEFVQMQYKRLAAGGVVANISSELVYAVNVKVPPLPEQRKIAAILSTWDKAICTTEQLLANSQQQKKALMQQLLTGKKRLLDEKGERFRGEWSKTKVGDLIIQHSEKSDRNGQYPVLTSSRQGMMFQKDYYNGRDVASEDTTGYNVVPFGYFTYRHMSDDLIFSFNINELCEKGIVSTLYPVFKAKEDKVNPYILRLMLNDGHEFKKFSLEQKQGGSRTYMYLSKLKELRLNIPCIDEQQKIAAVLTAANQEIEALQNKLEALKQEKKALMQQLLTGKRRVKVDEVAA